MKPTYQPADIEARWYTAWEDSGAFSPEVNPAGEPFTIVLPPPNVTGVLHMGHALNHAMQDAVIRRRRMQGYAALWLPGTDHAGIATQMVVERELAAEGMDRLEMGRDAFVEQVWAWKRRFGCNITQQMRALGDSCDWSRERFTFDEGLSKAVREVFVRLYEEDLIYRGYRIINWSPGLQTALSDIEVEYRDVDGELVHIVYPFTDGPMADGRVGITVATTRTETMLGDTGVAVNPDDKRYQDVIGKTVRLPLMDRDILIVADKAVDQSFGTGAVKVTPAHDPLDFEIGKRHDLDPIKVIGEDGAMTANAGRFEGLDRFEARIAVKDALAEAGALESVEPHRHSVGHCSRSDVVIEPLLSNQWFVKVGPLVGPAMDVIKDGTSRFLPERWQKNYFHWMENLHDWCVSRQVWWGHRIPAWYCDTDGTVIVAREEPTVCTECGSTELRADDDVLDTWFSSALWPFSTLGWPDETEDMKRFYPTGALVTGFDIIFFWVARMLMTGLKFTDESPFADIVIHGLVRAEDGQKMSKSIGNVVDPLELIDKYGADSLRLSLLQSAAPGHDIPFNHEWVDAARRFGNKLWNALRFAVDHVGISGVPANGGYPDDPGPADRWILGRLNQVTSEYDALSDDYRFSDAVPKLYSFVWSEVFDWYLEMAKVALRDPARDAVTKQTLGVVLRDILKLFHPIIPFVTEELWSELVGESMVITASWPTPPKVESTRGVEELQQLIVAVRSFRGEHNLGAKRVTVLLDDPEGIAEPWWAEQMDAIGRADLRLGAPDDVHGHARLPASEVTGYVPLQGLVDLEAERPRLSKAIAEVQGLLEGARGKIGNVNFVERAPSDVVANERQKVADLEDQLVKLGEQLEQLG